MGISRISQARDRRNRIAAIADWVAENVPWTVDASEWPAFHSRWPCMNEADLAEVEQELERRGDAVRSVSDAASVAAGHPGRSDGSSAAAAWLLEQFPRADIFDPEFVERFAHLTRQELLWAAIEHRTLIGAAVAEASTHCR